MGMDASVVGDTVARYNSLYAGGTDLDFHKSAKFFKPVQAGPYAAFDFSTPLQSYFTLGGLAINENAQVLDNSGEVIAGLYSAGRNAGTIYSDEYVGSGGSTSDAMIFGRIAGQNLAAE
jgi:3-oxo-5alpha-steroid 4-dehydrogenase